MEFNVVYLEAFILWEKGYDVWLPNNRGTQFSKQHVSLTSKDFKYWDFSFHEIGLYDYPAIVSYIKVMTNRSDIIFFGHSMATTSIMVYSSLKPDHAKNNIKMFVLLSPVGYFKHYRSPLRYVVHLASLMQAVFGVLRIGSIRPDSIIISLPLRVVVYLPLQSLTYATLLALFGWTPKEIRPEIFNVIISIVLKEFSLKIVYHYAQILKSDGVFRWYDYGRKKNMELYNSRKPPEYPLEKISTPMYLITSSSDSMSTIKDANSIYRRLSKTARTYGRLDISGINHIDFLFGSSVKEKIYNPVFNILNKIM